MRGIPGGEIIVQGGEPIMKSEPIRTAGMSRRSFLTCAALAGAGVAALGAAGCAPQGDAGSAEDPEVPASNVPAEIVATHDADVVIVGAGMSGLACAVQAGIDGLKTLLIEKAPEPGGNGLGVEGMFAVGSSMQKELGIDIQPRDILTAEMQAGQWCGDYSLWLDLVNKSAENIEWCKEQGVIYSGVVDNYYTGLHHTMHWFKNGHAAEGYIPQMFARVQELGVETLFNTAATTLIQEDGVVKGLYAKTEEGDIQVNAKAVILATGGIGNNAELQVKQGWGCKVEDGTVMLAGSPNMDGDGYRMAIEAGARDYLPHSCQLLSNFVPAFGVDNTAPYDDPLTSPAGGLGAGGPVLWVNQDADRFMDEAIYMRNMQLQAMAVKENRESYVVFDQSTVDSFLEISDAVSETLKKGLEENAGNSIYSADTFEGLAEAFGLDADQFVATVERYNELCAGGEDLDFGKDAAYMKPIVKAPYYIGKIAVGCIVTIGSVYTNKRREVLDFNLNAIPGLYAIGVDGVMLYHHVYTINMPGTCCGNNINSGREAAQSAAKYIATLA